MSSPLVWKVYSPTEQVGAVRYAEEAAALVSLYGDGGQVKVDGRIVWREGRESQTAGESFDFAAGVMHGRRRENAEAHYQRVMGTVRCAGVFSAEPRAAWGRE